MIGKKSWSHTDASHQAQQAVFRLPPKSWSPYRRLLGKCYRRSSGYPQNRGLHISRPSRQWPLRYPSKSWSPYPPLIKIHIVPLPLKIVVSIPDVYLNICFSFDFAGYGATILLSNPDQRLASVGF